MKSTNDMLEKSVKRRGSKYSKEKKKVSKEEIITESNEKESCGEL